MAKIPDLWPAKFTDLEQPTPVMILRQQAVLLGDKTNNVLTAFVESRQIDVGEFGHTFVVQAPLLGYRHPILRAAHGVRVYPVSLTILVEGARSYTDKQLKADFGVPSGKLADLNPDQFQAALKAVLGSRAVGDLIGSLIAQSRDAETDDGEE